MDQIGEFMVFASCQDWSSFEKPGFSSVMNRQWLYWASAFSLGVLIYWTSSIPSYHLYFILKACLCIASAFVSSYHLYFIFIYVKVHTELSMQRASVIMGFLLQF